jgi:hypothetical protein
LTTPLVRVVVTDANVLIILIKLALESKRFKVSFASYRELVKEPSRLRLGTMGTRG